MGQDNSTPRGPKAAPTGGEQTATPSAQKGSREARPGSETKTVLEMEAIPGVGPASTAGAAGGTSSAPTVPMRPLRVEKADRASSAPTVPMRPIRLPAADSPGQKAAPAPGRASEQAPRPPSPTPSTPIARAPEAPKPPPSPAADLQRLVTVQKLPGPQRPLTAPAQQPKPPQKERQAPEDAPRKAGLSTSVMLKASKLHMLIAQAERDKKEALVRRGSGRATRAPFPAIRPGAQGEGSSTPREVIVQAPQQGYPGQRTVSHTQSVINQYAVATNPRYAPTAEAPHEPGHLFVFDVMNSLHTTLEHAFSAGAPGQFRPGTLGELWKWLNETAPSRGWRGVGGSALLEAAARGLPVIAMAETPVGPRFAVVEPGPPGPDGKLRLASAHAPRGQQQTPEQIFGSSVVRYLAHD
jgi:hypothetical protein